VKAPLRVTFVFASRGIGGAERSMLRLMGEAHPHRFDCRVIERGPENPWFRTGVEALGIPFHRVGALDARAFARLLRRDPPDVLYVFGRFRTVLWALEARRAGVRCVVAAERSAANRASDRLARALDRRLVSAYIANSEHAARRLRAWSGPSGPPVFVVRNGIAVDAAVPVPADGKDVVLCVGNITRNKGQDVLLEAVRRLQARRPGLQALLVGRDDTKGEFFRRAAARGLGATYVWRGFRHDLRDCFAAARVLALPTRHREGLPTALLEAMRAGLAVVASRVGGVDEVVEDGRTGLLVPPGDASALADALERLLGEADLRQRLASAGRQHVVAHHGLRAMVGGHAKAFAIALAHAAGTGLAASPEPEDRATARPKVAHVTTVALSLRYLLLAQLDAIRAQGYDVFGISAPGPDAAVLSNHGISHRPIPMTRRLTPVRDVVSLFRLWWDMRKGRFTIVHTHTPKPGLLGQIAARLAGVPVVVNTLHGFYFHDRMHPLARRGFIALERLAARFSDLVLSQNPEDVETAVREGIVSRDRIRLLGNGIDLDRFEPRRVSPGALDATRSALGIPESAPVVGFVGRRVAEKGLFELLVAMRTVREAHPGVRLLVVGPADDEKRSTIGPAEAEAEGLEDAVVFAGTREDMPEMYALMDVFVLPSHREGFPRAAMEAAAMARPAVVTDIRGCRQVVAHGRNGLLFPVGDVNALAAAIVCLLDAPRLARRLGDEGRLRAESEFDERRVFARVIEAYDQLLRTRGLPRAAPLPRAVGEGEVARAAG